MINPCNDPNWCTNFSPHKGDQVWGNRLVTHREKEDLMNKFLKNLSILAALITFLNSACGTRTVQPQPEEKAATYQTILGKSLNDKNVVDFIASNNCSPAAEFRLCKDAGMAFWGDSSQIVKMVYLYSGNTDGFRRYRGELPYGLTFYDPMWRVQEKLSDPDTGNPLQQLGLPDEVGSPDHMHYWALYKRLGMTVIYNSPGKDEDAYIYAIMMSQ